MHKPMTKTALLATVSGLVGLVGLVAAEPSAHAFTTGGHFTATDRGLKRAGFDVNAIRHVQAANYMVDHMVNMRSEILLEDGTAQRASNVAKFFHMDGLWLAGYIEREFAFIDKALAKGVADGKARRDPRVILDALGIASHAVQDFYSHANFADVDWQSWKGTRIVTMDDTPRDLWDNPLLTGRWAESTDVKRLLTGMPSVGGPYGSAPESSYPNHGSSAKECSTADGQKDCGVNHDGARRRNNLVAIMMAAEATFDLAERAKSLLQDPTLWSGVQRPGPSSGVDRAMDRAQAMSMAAGQWGYERSESYAQIVIAYAATGGTTSFDVAWAGTLLSMWSAAPTAHATGGGADPFPPNHVTLFGLKQPVAPPDPSIYAGSYGVVWGGRRGTLELVVSAPYLKGRLSIDNKVFKDNDIRVRADGGLELQLGATENTADPKLTGIVYVTGTSRELSGFLRDSVAGVPDGFVASKQRLSGIVTPTPPTTIRQ